MKKIFLALIIFFLLSPVYGVSFFENPENQKSIVFVSRYESSSMDPETFEYFKKMRDDYSVYLIKDTDVSSGNSDWRNARDASELIFVTSLSEDVLGNENNFCNQISSVLNLTKGIIFAGNSTIFNNESVGCMYTEHFDFANPINNTEMDDKDRVKITAEHEITEGYELKDYNLTPGKVYPIPSPKNHITLGTVYGDPDGSGSYSTGNYPFLNIWQGLSYKVVTWGIDGYTINCDNNCLGWGLFTQMVSWATEKKGMSFNISTNKGIYEPGEEVQISIESEIEMSSVTGELDYPDQTTEPLFFTGSGKRWSSVYLLEQDDPLGYYNIIAQSGDASENKTFEVNLLNIELSVDNSTENIEIGINIKDIQGSVIDDIDSVTKIDPPQGDETTHLSDRGNFDIIYDVSKTGLHLISIKVNYSQRTIEKTMEFFGRVSPNITFTPENFTLKLNNPGNLTERLIITNNGEENLVNVICEFKGDVNEIVDPETINLDSIVPGGSEALDFNLTIPDTENTYTGWIEVNHSGGLINVPITIELKYSGKITITPESTELSILKNEKRSLEFEIQNTGLGNLIIQNITILGDLTSWGAITEEPRIIRPNNYGVVKVTFDTQGFYSEDLITKLNGNLVIKTENETKYVNIEMDVIGDLLTEMDSFYEDFRKLDSKIQSLKRKTDTDDLINDLNELRADLEIARNQYEIGNYSASASLVEAIKNGIADLDAKITQTKENVIKKREGAATKTVLIAVLVIAIIGGYFLYKKYSEGKKFKWVYKKWSKK